jgi:hypothetical protein
LNNILGWKKGGHAERRVFYRGIFGLLAKYGGNLIISEVVRHIENAGGCPISQSSNKCFPFAKLLKMDLLRQEGQ